MDAPKIEERWALKAGIDLDFTGSMSLSMRDIKRVRVLPEGCVAVPVRDLMEATSLMDMAVTDGDLTAGDRDSMRKAVASLRACLPKPKLKPCPNPRCRSTMIVYEKGFNFVRCLGCDLYGPDGGTPEEGRALWNELPR